MKKAFNVFLEEADIELVRDHKKHGFHSASDMITVGLHKLVNQQPEMLTESGFKQLCVELVRKLDEQKAAAAAPKEPQAEADEEIFPVLSPEELRAKLGHF